MATKFWTKGAITRFVRDICKIFASIGKGRGFRGWAIDCYQSLFSRPTPVAMATKFGAQLAIIRLVYEISARFLCQYGGFRGWASECCQSSFTPTDPRCNGNEIWDKMGYNLTYVRDIYEILAFNKGF